MASYRLMFLRSRGLGTLGFGSDGAAAFCTSASASFSENQRIISMEEDGNVAGKAKI
jgi:hypothetical protein